MARVRKLKAMVNCEELSVKRRGAFQEKNIDGVFGLY